MVVQRQGGILTNHSSLQVSQCSQLTNQVLRRVERKVVLTNHSSGVISRDQSGAEEGGDEDRGIDVERGVPPPVREVDSLARPDRALQQGDLDKEEVNKVSRR